MNHLISKDGETCSCGSDTCLCQVCACFVCGTKATWMTIPGKKIPGNVCDACLPKGVATVTLERDDVPRRTARKEDVTPIKTSAPPRRVKTTTTAIVWSDEQEAIFEYAHHGEGNLVIRARAGTGKTTTAKAMFEFMPENRILYAVFNKKNQKEAEEKITDHRVEVLTLHSLGFRFIKKIWPNAKPEPSVEFERAETCAPDGTPEDLAAICKLVAFAKNTTINTTITDLQLIQEEQDIWCNRGADWLWVKAEEVLELSKKRRPDGFISFNDMVWLPVVLNLVKPTYDAGLIDEGQDMSLPQLTMARRAIKGRVVVVGDDQQAIYSFRGAVVDGLKMMQETLNAKTLSLTVTRRCPRVVVEHVNEIVPDFKAAPEAPEGLLQNINEVGLLKLVKIGDAILSRLNAPLMPLALSLLRKDIPARIEGRDIGKQLIGMVKSMKARSVPHFIERVEAWAAKQRERLEKSKNSEKKLEQVSDMQLTLVAIAEGATSVSDIEARLNNLFQDTDENSKPAVILSSTHKAKGLEWKRVFVLTETYRRSKGGEEARLYYVACTRSMHDLYLVGGRGQSQDEPHGREVVTEAKPVSPATTFTPSTPPRRPAPPALPPPRVVEDVTMESPLPGMVWREPGVVFLWQRAEYVSIRLGHSNAKCKCLSRQTKVVTDHVFGETKEFQKPARIIEVSSQIGKEEVIRRMTKDELKNFIAGARNGDGTTNAGTESEYGMAKTKANNELPTQGRAAFIHQLKAKSTPKADALVKAQAKFSVTLGLFNKIWERGAKGAGEGAKASTPPKKATKGAKAGKSAPPKRVAAKPAAPATNEATPVASESSDEAAPE
jgi:DNA helicase-2/ATP-dependent DNA helicase PcrA